MLPPLLSRFRQMPLRDVLPSFVAFSAMLRLVAPSPCAILPFIIYASALRGRYRGTVTLVFGARYPLLIYHRPRSYFAAVISLELLPFYFEIRYGARVTYDSAPFIMLSLIYRSF